MKLNQFSIKKNILKILKSLIIILTKVICLNSEVYKNK